MTAPSDRAALTVLYDDGCPLCRRLRQWLSGQVTMAPVEFLAAASIEARRRFPALDHERSLSVLTAVRADGAVYEGERAWLLCAWLLPSWQGVAEHFSGRRLFVVKGLARLVDAVRHRSPRLCSYGESCEDPNRCRITAPAPPSQNTPAGRGTPN